MKTRDLAKLFNVSQRTIQRWLREGKIAPEHAYRTPGGHWRLGKPPTLADLDPLDQAATQIALAQALAEIRWLLEDRKARRSARED